MTDNYDDELLKDTDDDIVKPNNAPSRSLSGWGIAPVVIVAIIGIIVGGVVASITKPDFHRTPSTPEETRVGVDPETIARLVELDEILEANPDDVETRLERATIHVEIGDIALAELDAREILRQNPESSEAWAIVGMYYWLQELDCDKAEEAWNKSMEYSPDADHTQMLKFIEQCPAMIAQASATPTGQ
ncbi:MAG: hypothetical protein FWG08_07085 [Propionibacteriaceae bacterium]|nr:hypothetical protein [Propionibacteriaceae bacterium]